MRSRPDPRKQRLQAELASVLRRHLAPLRASQRGGARELPPEPSALDRARFDDATPAELARASALLCGAGFTRADVARGAASLRARQLADGRAVNDASDGGPADDVTRRRARELLRGRA